MKLKLQEGIDPDEIEAEATRTGRHWKEILREKLRVISSGGDEIVNRQRRAILDMVERCKQIQSNSPTPQDSTNLSTGHDKILYGSRDV